jgi:ribonuclease E
MPRSRTTLVRYEERVPLFSKFGVESQIERIFARTVQLPSGGAIVIDPTEALTAIDVNSGRSSGGGSHEEMVLQTNLEAAREAIRQLRLRDLGGLVVIDFIDLRSPKNRRLVEREVKEALKVDRARSSVGRISSNGLLEINRQKIQRSLSARAHRPCPTCSGTGRVPSIETIGLNLLRRIEGRAATGRLLKARVELHSELAEAIQNTRRRELSRIEEEFDIEIEIVASHRLLGPEEQIEWRDRPASSPTPLRPAELAARRAAPPPPAAPVVFEISSAEDDDDADEGGESGEAGESSDASPAGRKRRRRGGRRRTKKNGESAGTSVAAPGPAVAPNGEPAPAENGVTNEPAAADGGAPKRRRRGGRGRGRRGRGGDSPAPGAGSAAAGE